MNHKTLHLSGCVILNDKGEILLLHRNTPIRKQWETPGGKLEKGEKPERAAEREIEEELGIDVKILQKLGKKNFIEDGNVMTYSWFLAKVLSGTPSIMEKEKFDDLRFFPWKTLLKMKDKLSSNAHNLIESYFEGRIKLN